MYIEVACTSGTGSKVHEEHGRSTARLGWEVELVSDRRKERRMDARGVGSGLLVICA